MAILNLKRLLGKRYRVVYEPNTDGTTSEFYIIPCDKGYIAPLNATELLVVHRARHGDEIREKLSEFPIVRETNKLIAVAVMPKEIDEIAYLIEPFQKAEFMTRQNQKPIYRMPPVSHWQADARAA